MKLITESNYNIEINESKEKSLFIEGIFASAETKNHNGRVYPKAILEREIDKVQSDIKEKTLIGELGHPTDRSEVDLAKSTILVEDVYWKGNDVCGKAKILNTPYGQIAKNLITDGVRFGISSRGLGTVSKTGFVNEDFSLISWDLVHSASNPGSKFVNGILESIDFNNPKEIALDELDIAELKKGLDFHYKQIWQVLDKISI